MTQLLDENRDSLARRAALKLTNRWIMDDTLRGEVENMRACLDNMLDNLFEQFKFDQMEHHTPTSTLVLMRRADNTSPWS